jgi:hypothetical protein
MRRAAAAPTGRRGTCASTHLFFDACHGLLGVRNLNTKEHAEVRAGLGWWGNWCGFWTGAAGLLERLDARAQSQVPAEVARASEGERDGSRWGGARGAILVARAPAGRGGYARTKTSSGPGGFAAAARMTFSRSSYTDVV